MSDPTRDSQREPRQTGRSDSPGSSPATGHAAIPESAGTAPRARRRGRRLWAMGSVAAVITLIAALALMGRDAEGEEAVGRGDASARADVTAETSGADEDAAEPIPVEVAAVELGEVTNFLSATTNLVAEHEVKVLAEVEGRVQRTTVEEGSYVRKGQVLAVLAREEAEIALEKARVREENARRVHERAAELARAELISLEELDQRRLDFEVAEQERREAEWRLARTEILAPIEGRVSDRSTQVGQHMRPGDELFQITGTQPLIARIYVPEREVLSLELGGEAHISLDAAPDVTFPGRIRQIAPVVDVATGTVKITVEATDPPSAVRPGGFVTVRVVRGRRAGVVLVPANAILRDGREAHVFVVGTDANGARAARRTVVPGMSEGDRVEILSGLEPGDRVVVAGQGALSDGAPVRLVRDRNEIARLATGD
jgi:membrane fusion protein, multidrug efflux system